MFNKKILVTGGTGFVGRKVVELLLSLGYEVHLLGIPPFLEERAFLFQYHIDLFDMFALEKFFSKYNFTNLIHLAWCVGQGCQTSDENLDWVCTSLNLLKMFKKSGGKRVLFTGSMSEYDYSYGYMTEDVTPLNNEFLYGKSKAALYSLAKEFCRLNRLDFKWARLFNIYGENERDARLVPSVILSMLKNEDVKVSTCTKFQDYLHVDDIAAGIVALFESDIQGAVNICSGEPVQLRYIVEKIAELTNFKGNVLYGAIPTYFEEPFVVGNNSKLKEKVKFFPKHTLKSGLEKTVEWYRRRLNV